MKKIRVLETFSGIGAPRKALERGSYYYEIVDSIEIDPYPVKVYNAIFDDNVVPQDITTWNKTKEEIGEIDLLWNSSPCTDISISGKNMGATKGSGTRSSLIWEIIRISKNIRPKIVIWENVKNLTSNKHIDVLNEYIDDLEKLGYKSTYKILNAVDYEIPQHRERIFVISIRNDVNINFEFPAPKELKIELRDLLEEKVDEKYYISEALQGKIVEYTSKRVNKKPRVLGGIGEKKSNNGKQWYQQDRIYDNEIALSIATKFNPYYIDNHSNIRRLSPLEIFRLMGFDDEDYYKAELTGLTDSRLLKCAGNSVVVNVIEAIFDKLFYEYKKPPIVYIKDEEND